MVGNKRLRKNVKILISISITVFILWAFIGEILSNTPEIAQHNMNGAEGNVVYYNKDGKEAVFDKNDKLVTDPENQGSFNYYIYTEEPYKHFIYDTLPWIKWGNTADDQTTKADRIKAFLSDFRTGIKITFNSK